MSRISENEILQRLKALADVQPSAKSTDRALQRVRLMLKEQEQAHKTKDTRIWRTIMQSKITKLAAAAVIVVAALVIFHLPGGRSGIALGKVLDNIQSIHAYTHRTKLTTGGGSQSARGIDFVMYRSVDYGIRRDSYVKGELVSRLYIPASGTKGVEVLPTEKKYVNAQFDEKQLAEINQKTDPREITKLFMAFEHKRLEPKTIDGLQAEGIEIDDPNFGKAVFERGVGRFWVDPKADLPVLIELEGTSAGGTVQINIVIDQFQWHAQLTQADFEPNIPADYTLMADVDLSDNEQTLIKGLKAFAQITGGKYPIGLDQITANKQVASAFTANRRRQGVSLETQPTKQEMDGLLAIQGACMFYARLLQEEKGPAYYGDKVTAEFPHAVLMRWKTADNSYRVVFGDLSVKDVSAQELARLEAAPLNLQQQPANPQPADGTVGTSITGLKLSWLPGAYAVKHKVFFGTSPDKLSLLATVGGSTCDQLPTLERNQTYYWRVDAVRADGSVTTGEVWSFNTGKLVARWKFDEAANTAADSSGNGHAGSLVGNYTNVAGIRGNALQLDGAGYLDLGKHADFDITGHITVAAWVKVNAFDKDWQAIITKGDTAWRLSRGQGNGAHFAFTGLWPEWLNGRININDGKWHHVAGVYDGSKIYLYVDGRVDVSANVEGTPNINDHPVFIGENAEHTGRGWNGLIDDVRIYSYALTPEEIKALFENPADSASNADQPTAN